MSATLADAATRMETLARFAALSPDAVPRWGRMTAPQMLAHCTDALRMAVGELPVRAVPVPFARLGIVKWLMLYVLPFPKNAPTARELRAREPVSWAEELAELDRLVGRFAPGAGPPAWAPHPLFGALGAAQWGVLAQKHLDHHLRQFGR